MFGLTCCSGNNCNKGVVSNTLKCFVGKGDDAKSTECAGAGLFDRCSVTPKSGNFLLSTETRYECASSFICQSGASIAAGVKCCSGDNCNKDLAASGGSHLFLASFAIVFAA